MDLQLAAGLRLEPCDRLSHVAAQQLAHPASSRVSSVREATYLGSAFSRDATGSASSVT